MSKQKTRFEAGLNSEDKARLGIRFANGYEASVVVSHDGLMVALAHRRLPDRWEIGEQEASPEELAAFLTLVAGFPTR